MLHSTFILPDTQNITLSQTRYSYLKTKKLSIDHRCNFRLPNTRQSHKFSPENLNKYYFNKYFKKESCSLNLLCLLGSKGLWDAKWKALLLSL